MIRKIRLPRKVKFILETFRLGGFEAYIVGGCVRDSLIGRVPADWDIAASALPDKIKVLFEKTVDTGIKHGTVTILMDGEAFEATTYRVDGRYADNRRPENVTFSGSIIEDLSRRDFTVNAIAYNPDTGFVDPFGGIADIESKLLRSVGDAGERFREDALRMLRAIRFSAQLGYQIDAAVLEAIQRNRSLIRRISFERIRDELNGILLSDNPEAFALIRETGLLQHILPELDDAMAAAPGLPGLRRTESSTPEIQDIWRSVKAAEKEIPLRWAVLLGGLAPIAGPSAANMLKRLRLDNRSIHSISLLVRFAGMAIEPGRKGVLRVLSVTGTELFTHLLKLKTAFAAALPPEYGIRAQENLQEIKELYHEIIENNYCYSLKGLAVDGDDITGLGVPPGKAVGRILRRLLDMVLDEPERNEKTGLLALAKQWIKDDFGA